MLAWVSIDLDGTLLDTIDDLHAACAAMLAELDRPPRKAEETRRFVGQGMHLLVERSLDGEGQTPPELLAAGVAAFRYHYGLINGRHARAYPGVREGLAALRAQGLALAVVTNKPIGFTEPLLERTGLRDNFSVVIGGDSLPQKKPHPAPILEVCRQIGQPPGAGVHIGDSRHDAEAARAAGCLYFHVPYGYADGAPVDSADYDALVSSLVDAAARIDALNRSNARAE
jgi:phosphoglycolate phosphatase